MDSPHKPPDSEWSPLEAELPLDPLEAFRLASFGIEYVPQFAEVYVDSHCNAQRLFQALPGDKWVHAGGNYVANLSAFRRFYGDV